MTIFIILFAIFWAFVCNRMAKKNGRGEILATILGLFFGLFAVIGYAIAGKTSVVKMKEMDEMLEARERAKNKIAEEKNN